MRRILIEQARRKRGAKHGGGRERVELDEAQLATPPDGDDLIALDDALQSLAATDRQAAEVVRLRYFAGLSIPQAAAVLGVAPRTAGRLWAYARAWLHREMAAS